MALKIGIVGLPNVGKSTLFKALTRKDVLIANYPFTTIDPNVGLIVVPDKKLEKLAKLVTGAKVVPAAIEIVDVAGLVKGAHEGQGLGNQFLSHLLPMDALVIVLGTFTHKDTISVIEDQQEALGVIENELLQKDQELEKRRKEKKDTTILPKLTQKPRLIVCNGGDNQKDTAAAGLCKIKIDAKLELELQEIPEAELKELGMQSKLAELIHSLYGLLNLITFYTLKGGKELRAWPVQKGTPAQEAGGAVHSDFAEKFIKAEVVNLEKLLEAGSWNRAKDLGLIKTEGKEYVIQDGDVVEFKI